MDREVCAFLDALDAAVVIAKDLPRILKGEFGLLMLADSKLLFDALEKEKRS